MNKYINNKKIKLIVLFIVFEVFFTAITLPFSVYHGPFKRVKKTIVKSVMTTLNHQWMATVFLSTEEINKIINENYDNTIKNKLEKNNIKHLNDINIDQSNDDKIELYEIKSKKYCGKVIIVHNPNRIKVGYTEKIGVEGQVTSEIAKEYDAMAAINGGGFKDNPSGLAWSGTGAVPSGILISNGRLIYNDLKDKNEEIYTMGITDEGHLLVGKYSFNDLEKLKVKNALSFGPPLIINGKKTIEKGDGGWGIAPRTAIGQRKDGTIILLTIDGRQVKSIGATLKEVQEILYEFGAYNAANLDGGFSTTMYYNGKVISNPPFIIGERAVPSIVYVEKE